MTTVVMIGQGMRELQLRDAKASFSAVVEQAAEGEGTVVTRHGRPMAVVLGYDAWQRLIGIQPSFAELLLGFPDVEEIARDPAVSRDLDL
jgi:prevent-host-death family protein